MQKRPLWPYVKNQNVYKCPADHSTVVFNEVTYPRILTMSMNLYVGGFAPPGAPAVLAPMGAGLCGSL